MNQTSKEKDSIYVHFLGVRIAKVTFEKIETIAERTGKTVSIVVREALEKGLNRVSRR